MSTAVVTYGRFNPPHKGHGLLFSTVLSTAAEVNGVPMIGTSSTFDSKNVLGYFSKIQCIELLYPEVKELLFCTSNILKHFSTLKENNLIYICGSDRYEEFSNLLPKYNGTLYNFDSITIKRIERTEHSSTELKEFVRKRDYEGFSSLVPDTGYTEEYYNFLCSKL